MPSLLGHTKQLAPPRACSARPCVRAPMRRQNGEGERDAGLCVESAIERLEEAVEQETAALQCAPAVDLKDFNDRKSQGLLELTGPCGSIDGAAPERPAAAACRACAPSSTSTAPCSKMHLEAVREISAAMADAMREAEFRWHLFPSVGRQGQA